MEERQTVEGAKPSTSLLLLAFDDAKSTFRGQVFTSGLPAYPLQVVGQVKGSRLELTVDAERSPVMATFVYEKLGEARYRGSSSILAGDQEFKESAEFIRTAK